MGDHDQQVTDYSDPAANAPDAAAYGKGKGKAVDAHDDVNMGEEDEDESSDEDEDEMVCFDPARLLCITVDRPFCDYLTDARWLVSVGSRW